LLHYLATKVLLCNCNSTKRNGSGVWIDQCGQIKCGIYPWQPLRDLEHAKAVVVAMKDWDWCVYGLSGVITAEFSHKKQKNIYERAKGKTPGRAICMAAWKASKALSKLREEGQAIDEDEDKENRADPR